MHEVQAKSKLHRAPDRRETPFATDTSLSAEFLNPRVRDEVGLDTSIGEKAMAAGMAAMSNDSDAEGRCIAAMDLGENGDCTRKFRSGRN